MTAFRFENYAKQEFLARQMQAELLRRLLAIEDVILICDEVLIPQHRREEADKVIAEFNKQHE